MKFDKQNMIKNRFWLLLGGFSFFWFIGFAVLVFGDPIGNAKKDYESVGKDLKNSSNPKHVPTYVPPWQAATKASKAQKEKAWDQAWDYQKSLLTLLEEGLRGRWEKGKARDFKSWVDAQKAESASLNAQLTNFRSEYKSQFKKLDQVVAPAEFLGGLVGFEQMMAPAGGSDSNTGGRGMPGGPAVQSGGPAGLPGAPGAAGANSGGRNIINLWRSDLPPNLEEAWIAQEDFCVKRELLLAIGSTIKSAARLEPGPTGFWQAVAWDDTPSADNVKRYRCHNSHWELDLVLKKTGANGGWVLVRTESTLTNVDLDRRTLNVSSTPDERNPKGMLQFRALRLSSKGDPFIPLEIQSESLAWGASLKLSTRKPVDPANPAPARESDPADETDFLAPEDIKEIDQVFDWETSPVRIIEELRIPALSQRMADVPLKAGLGFSEKKEEEAKPAATGSAAPAPGAEPRPPSLRRRPRTGSAAAAASMTDINKLDRLRYLHVTEQSRHLPFGMALIVEKNNVSEVLAALANTPLRVQITQVGVQRVRGVASSRAASRQTLTSTRDDDANLVELVVYGVCTLYERVPEKADKSK